MMTSLVALLSNLGIKLRNRAVIVICASVTLVLLELFSLYLIQYLLKGFSGDIYIPTMYILGCIAGFLFKTIISVYCTSTLQEQLISLQSDLSNSIVNIIDRSPYFQISNTPKEIFIRAIIQLPQQIVNGGLVPLSVVLIDGVTIILIIMYSAYLVGAIVFVLYIFLLVASAGIYLFSRSHMRHAGKEFDRQESARLNTLNRYVNDLKYFKANKSIIDVVPEIKHLNVSYCEAVSVLEVYRAVPKYWIDLAGGVTLGFILLLNSAGFATLNITSTSIIGVFLIRLMPSINRVLGSISYLSFIKPSVIGLDKCVSEIRNITNPSTLVHVCHSSSDCVTIKVRSSLRDIGKLNPNVTNNSPSSNCEFSIVLDNVNILKAPSGWGKTFILDSLAGLNSDFTPINLIANATGTPNCRPQAYVSQSCSINGEYFLRDCIECSLIDNNLLFLCLDKFLPGLLEKLPLGLNTYFGNSGYVPSGGEVKKLHLAKAISFHPNLLLLDEITSGLDNKSLTEVCAFLESYARDGCTTIIISHKDRFDDLCHRIYLA